MRKIDAFFADYASHHRTAGNKWFHRFGIPMIMLTLLGMLARVETVEYLGADSIVTCRVGSETLTARLPGQVGLARGSEVRLAWEQDAVHLFDAASGLLATEDVARIIAPAISAA